MSSITPEMRRFQRRLLIIVLIPTALLLVGVFGLYVVDTRSRNADSTAKARDDRSAALATEERIKLARAIAELGVKQVRRGCERGNDIKGYLRWRAQVVEASGDKDVARRIFPIVDCSKAAQPQLSPAGERAYIAALIARGQ